MLAVGLKQTTIRRWKTYQNTSAHLGTPNNEPGKQEEFERPEKRVRFELNGYTVYPNYDTPPLMYFASSSHATLGIAAVGATRVEASTIPPESVEYACSG
jgi:hypothetical protein